MTSSTNHQSSGVMASAARQSRFTNYTMSNAGDKAGQTLGGGISYQGPDWKRQNIWSSNLGSFPKSQPPTSRGNDENGQTGAGALAAKSDVDSWSRRGPWETADNSQRKSSGATSPTRTRDSFNDIHASSGFTNSRPPINHGPGFSLNRQRQSAFETTSNAFRYTSMTSDETESPSGYPLSTGFGVDSKPLNMRTDSRNGYAGGQAGTTDALQGYENAYSAHVSGMAHPGRPQPHSSSSFPAQSGPTRAYSATQLDQQDLHETFKRSVTINDASDTATSNFQSARSFQFNPGSQPWDSNGVTAFKPGHNGFSIPEAHQEGIMSDYSNGKRGSIPDRNSPGLNMRTNLASPRHMSEASIISNGWGSRPASRDPRNGLENERRGSTNSYISSTHSHAIHLPGQQQPAFYPPHPYYAQTIPSAYPTQLYDQYGNGFRAPVPFPQFGLPYSPYGHTGLPMHPPHGLKSQDPISGGRSRLLDEFRATSKSAKKYELKDIYNYVVEFSGDQHGSRFIQSKLETANSDEKDQIFKELEPNAVQLMKDVFGNYVIQKFFEHGNQVQKKALASQMKGKMVSLSTEMYACRVVQKALEHVLVEQQAELVKELEVDIVKIIKDANGNHVVQKIIELVPRQYISFVMDSIRGQVIQLSQHNYGCRVIQRMMEHGSDADKATIMHELHQHAPMLTTDPYGNYVIQHIITHGKPEDRQKIISIVLGQIVLLSKNKLASNVVERCIVSGTAEDRTAIRKIITTPGPDGTSPLQLMMKDQYANYVVQKLLEKLNGAERQAFVEEMKPQFNSLKKVSNGRQIAAIDRLMSAVGSGAGSGAAAGLQVDVNSAAPTPNLTMEPNTPQSTSPPSTDSSSNDGVTSDESNGGAEKIDSATAEACPQVRIDEA
ncbi:hypothetical protein PpBr36_03357 [Pyricularia pennisetigena]|uniref:hypothetical protein n=1 Tax=Pyricularia pennisetigena TaxID=1578925 RepID=UPI00115010DA|nr:hypothetical protein PpBr36_03357 [Pyricularia pennisetigena]TLS31586.1 hypothetical protein PpBr36_03357 [Pyricularia pennisetigena]